MTIADLKTRLEQKVHGSYESISDVYGLISEAARNLLLMVDPMESKRVSQIQNAIYDSVYSYALPSDLKGDKILDIRPQANRQESDVINQTYQKDFDVFKPSDSFSIEMNSGVKTIRLNKPGEAGVVLNECDSLTDNGTWAADGIATLLSVDDFNKISGNASLKFNIQAMGATAYIENSTMEAQDLTDAENDGAMFVWVYLPSATAVTGITLSWGSSSANYWSKAVTAAADNTSFVVGWNLLRFDWSSAIVTGTPDKIAVNYAKVLFSYDGTALTSVRVDSIIARVGKIYEVIYYSKNLFKSSAGTWKETPTDDSDIIILDAEGQNLLLYEMCFLVGQEFGGEDSSFDSKFWEAKRDEVWKKYMRTYKTERRKPAVKYYRM